MLIEIDPGIKTWSITKTLRNDRNVDALFKSIKKVLKTTNKMTHQPDSVQVVIANVVARSSALAQTEELQKTKFALWL